MSTATVDRVLNNRAGVSAANRQRVMEAAKQLGYLPMADAVTLPSRPAHLEFFLPIGSNAFMADLARLIEDYAARLPLVASCKIHNLKGISPNALQAAVDRAVAARQWRRRHRRRPSQDAQHPARHRRGRHSPRHPGLRRPGRAALGLCRHRQPGGRAHRGAADGPLPRRQFRASGDGRGLALLSRSRGARDGLSLRAQRGIPEPHGHQRGREQRRPGSQLCRDHASPAGRAAAARDLLRRRRTLGRRAGAAGSQAAARSPSSSATI